MPGQAIITIQNQAWQVTLATDPWEQVQGLGGISGIAPGAGMLFDMGYEQEINVTTEPMLFPLDIAFLSEDLAVTEVYHNIFPGYLVNTTKPARFFLEVNAGEMEGIEEGSQADLELLALQNSSSGVPDWLNTLTGFMGFMLMAVFMSGLIRSQLGDEDKKSSGSPLLLAKTLVRHEYRIRMDRQGNIMITREKEPGRSVFLQFEADKELVYEILKKSEKNEMEKGWTVRIKDSEPRSSGLSELWQTSGQPELPSKNETPTPAGSQGLPAAHLVEKWRGAKARNSTQALRELDNLGPDLDTSECKEALADYQAIERTDYGEQEEYQEARDEAWENFLECLESLSAEEEERMAVEKQPSTIQGKGPTSKGSRLEYLVDSPEYLTQTIDDIGYRDRIDQAFTKAIARSRGGR
jgi:uncharacterized membrane protein (UPF0127 family)